MKQCPNCNARYGDDTLVFCLQDGTPLVAGIEAETPTVVFGETATVAALTGQPWRQSEVTRVATLKPEKRGSNTAVAIILTVLGMLVLFGVIGFAALIFWRNSQQPVISNAGNTANARGGLVNTNYNASPPPQMSPFANAGPTRAASTPFPTSNVDKSAPPVDDSHVDSEVSQRLNSWKSQAESLNVNGYMTHYAPVVDYYNKSGVSLSYVRSDKMRAFSRYNSMKVNLSNMTVTPDPSGQTATAVFDKEWDFQGNGSSSGKVKQHDAA